MTEPSPNVPAEGAGLVGGSVRAPRAFISYAHDSDAHREQVRDLWVFLCAHGVDARIDRVAAEQRQDWTLWMERQVAEADRILIVASPAYKQRAGYAADPGVGRGVQYEARLIRDLFYRDQTGLGRFLPVVLPGGSLDDVPGFLTPATTTVYRLSGFTVAGAEALLRVIHQRPGEIQPAIGPVPDLPTRGHTPATPTTTPAGTTSTGSLATPPPAPVLRHQLDITLAIADNGTVTTTVALNGAQLGNPHNGRLPVGIEHCWDNLDLTDIVTERLAHLGTGLWTALFDPQVGRRLLELVDTSPIDTGIDLVFHLPEPLSWLPVGLLRVPTDQRLLATIAGVTLIRRLAGIDRPPVAGLAGPHHGRYPMSEPPPHRGSTRTRPLLLGIGVVAMLLLIGLIVIPSGGDGGTGRTTAPSTNPVPAAPPAVTNTDTDTDTEPSPAAPTATDTAQAGEVRRRTDSRPIALTGGYRVDLDSESANWDVDRGDYGTKFDLYLHGENSSVAGQIEGTRGAEFAPAGPVASYAECSAATAYVDSFDSDKINPPSSFCMKTTEGRLAHITLQNNESPLTIDVTVWQKAE